MENLKELEEKLLVWYGELAIEALEQNPPNSDHVSIHHYCFSLSGNQDQVILDLALFCTEHCANNTSFMQKIRADLLALNPEGIILKHTPVNGLSFMTTLLSLQSSRQAAALIQKSY